MKTTVVAVVVPEVPVVVVEAVEIAVAVAVVVVVVLGRLTGRSGPIRLRMPKPSFWQKDRELGNKATVVVKGSIVVELSTMVVE